MFNKLYETKNENFRAVPEDVRIRIAHCTVFVRRFRLNDV